MPQRTRDFRLERLARVVSGETPAPLKEGAKIVLHLIPLSAFEPGTKFDVNSLGRDASRIIPMYVTSWSDRFNFDRLLGYSSHSYLQVFRNGIIEAVEALLLEDRNGERIIPSIAYEKELLKALPRFLSIQKELGVDPPLFIMLSLVGVKGYTMAVDRFLMENSHPIDRDTLQVPEVMIERFDIDSTEVMRPAFNAVWNAAGFPRSMNYDKDGKWVAH
jgi:hypothetical protein